MKYDLNKSVINFKKNVKEVKHFFLKVGSVFVTITDTLLFFKTSAKDPE